MRLNLNLRQNKRLIIVVVSIVIICVLLICTINYKSHQISEIIKGQTYCVELNSFSWKNAYYLKLNEDGSFIVCNDSFYGMSKKDIIDEFNSPDAGGEYTDFVTKDFYCGHYYEKEYSIELDFERELVCKYYGSDAYFNDKPDEVFEYKDAPRINYAHNIISKNGRMILVEKSPEGNEYKYKFTKISDIDLKQEYEKLKNGQ